MTHIDSRTDSLNRNNSALLFMRNGFLSSEVHTQVRPENGSYDAFVQRTLPLTAYAPTPLRASQELFFAAADETSTPEITAEGLTEQTAQQKKYTVPEFHFDHDNQPSQYRAALSDFLETNCHGSGLDIPDTPYSSHACAEITRRIYNFPELQNIDFQPPERIPFYKKFNAAFERPDELAIRQIPITVVSRPEILDFDKIEPTYHLPLKNTAEANVLFNQAREFFKLWNTCEPFLKSISRAENRTETTNALNMLTANFQDRVLGFLIVPFLAENIWNIPGEKNELKALMMSLMDLLFAHNFLNEASYNQASNFVSDVFSQWDNYRAHFDSDNALHTKPAMIKSFCANAKRNWNTVCQNNTAKASLLDCSQFCFDFSDNLKTRLSQLSYDAGFHQNQITTQLVDDQPLPFTDPNLNALFLSLVPQPVEQQSTYLSYTFDSSDGPVTAYMGFNTPTGSGGPPMVSESAIMTLSGLQTFIDRVSQENLRLFNTYKDKPLTQLSYSPEFKTTLPQTDIKPDEVSVTIERGQDYLIDNPDRDFLINQYDYFTLNLDNFKLANELSRAALLTDEAWIKMEDNILTAPSGVEQLVIDQAVAPEQIVANFNNLYSRFHALILYYIRGWNKDNQETHYLPVDLASIYNELHQIVRSSASSHSRHLNHKLQYTEDTTNDIFSLWLQNTAAALSTNQTACAEAIDANFISDADGNSFILRYGLARNLLNNLSNNSDSTSPVYTHVQEQLDTMKPVLELAHDSIAAPEDTVTALQNWNLYQNLLQQSRGQELAQTGSSAVTDHLHSYLAGTISAADWAQFVNSLITSNTLVELGTLFFNPDNTESWLRHIDPVYATDEEGFETNTIAKNGLEQDAFHHLQYPQVGSFLNRLKGGLYDLKVAHTKATQFQIDLHSDTTVFVTRALSLFSDELPEGWPLPSGKSANLGHLQEDYNPSDSLYMNLTDCVLVLLGKDLKTKTETLNAETGEVEIHCANTPDIAYNTERLRQFFATEQGYYRSFCETNKITDEEGNPITAERSHVPYYKLLATLKYITDVVTTKSGQLSLQNQGNTTDTNENLERLLCITKQLMAEINMFLPDHPLDSHYHFLKPHPTTGRIVQAVVPLYTQQGYAPSQFSSIADVSLIHAEQSLRTAFFHPLNTFDETISETGFLNWYHMHQNQLAAIQTPHQLLQVYDTYLNKMSGPASAQRIDFLINHLSTAGAQYVLGQLHHNLTQENDPDHQKKHQQIKKTINSIGSIKELRTLSLCLESIDCNLAAAKLQNTTRLFAQELSPADRLWANGYIRLRIGATEREAFGEDEVLMTETYLEFLDNFINNIREQNKNQTIINSLLEKFTPEDEKQATMSLASFENLDQNKVSSLITNIHKVIKSKQTGEEKTWKQFYAELIKQRRVLDQYTVAELLYLTAKLSQDASTTISDEDMEKLVSTLSHLDNSGTQTGEYRIDPKQIPFNKQKIDRYLNSLSDEQREFLLAHSFNRCQIDYRDLVYDWLNRASLQAPQTKQMQLNAHNETSPLPLFWNLLLTQLRSNPDSSSQTLSQTQLVQQIDNAITHDLLYTDEFPDFPLPSFDETTQIATQQATEAFVRELEQQSLTNTADILNATLLAMDIFEYNMNHYHRYLDSETCDHLRTIYTGCLNDLDTAVSAQNISASQSFITITDQLIAEKGPLASMIHEESFYKIANYFSQVLPLIRDAADKQSSTAVSENDMSRQLAVPFLEFCTFQAIPLHFSTKIDYRYWYALQTSLHNTINYLEIAVAHGAQESQTTLVQYKKIYTALFDSFNKNDPVAYAEHSRFNPYGFTQQRQIIPMALYDILSLTNLTAKLNQDKRSFSDTNWLSYFSDQDPSLASMMQEPFVSQLVKRHVECCLATIYTDISEERSHKDIQTTAIRHWDDVYAITIITNYLDTLKTQAIAIKKEYPEEIALSLDELTAGFDRVSAQINYRITQLKAQNLIKDAQTLLLKEPEQNSEQNIVYFSKYKSLDRLIDDYDKLQTLRDSMLKIKLHLETEIDTPEVDFATHDKLITSLEHNIHLLDVYTQTYPEDYLSLDFANIIEAEGDFFKLLAPELIPFLTAFADSLIKNGMIIPSHNGEFLLLTPNLSAEQVSLAKFFVGRLINIAQHHHNEMVSTLIKNCFINKYQQLQRVENYQLGVNQYLAWAMDEQKDYIPTDVIKLASCLDLMGVCSHDLLRLSVLCCDELQTAYEKENTAIKPYPHFNQQLINTVQQLSEKDTEAALMQFNEILTYCEYMKQDPRSIPVIYTYCKIEQLLKQQLQKNKSPADIQTQAHQGLELLHGFSSRLDSLAVTGIEFLHTKPFQIIKKEKQRKIILKQIETLDDWEREIAQYFIHENLRLFPEKLDYDTELPVWDDLNRINKMLEVV